ncbi:MAG: hypothetical protein A2505_02780 [Deltaproteobacteria bacterium RIFOXYD12_FULL_55_16]|nr:MAG: hypothetical protein A2505_02780 [Deltaproteobacteria bacterium RIFOXYD12_FULL_55_16]
MNAPKEKDRFIIRFELGLLGMFSLTLVTGCIFFWMFIIGIWAGQTILKPASEEGNSSLTRIAGALQPETALVNPEEASGEKKNMALQEPPAFEAEWAATEPSFFVLQVAAVRDQDRAQQEMAQWRSRGYDAFSVPPEDKNDPSIRIFVGKFDKLADANQLAAKLEKEEKVNVYIALLPASRLQAP